MISNITSYNTEIKHHSFIQEKYTQVSNPHKRYNTDDIKLSQKDNVNFCGYKNAIKLNPYDMLKNENTAKAMEDYIRNGMFIHVPSVNGKKFGDAFWDLFMGLKKDLQYHTNTDEIYTELRKKAEEICSKETLDKAAQKQREERAEVLGRNVKTLLIKHGLTINPNAKYLDIGCGDGSVTKAISNELNLSEENVKGLEIIERDDFCNIKRYKFDGKNIPHSFNNADFVTIFNVLHHTKNEKTAKQLLKSTYNSMNDGGILMLREHNACSPDDVKYWQVRHLLPIRVSKVDPPCLVEDTIYHSIDEWTDIMKGIGFKPKFVKKDKQYNDIYSFYMGLQK